MFRIQRPLAWCAAFLLLRVFRLKRVVVAVSVVMGLACAAVADPFDAHWRDGFAELNGYRWSVTRYGEPRVGEAVMVFVTEPFSLSKGVKLNDPAKNPSDAVEVMKLNLVRDFQTGIYDYNTMVSVFSESTRFSPLKISFTSAEWCGHVYEELAFEPARIRSRVSSYFEDESSSGVLAREKDGVTEDGLYILLRGLRGDFLGPGEGRSVPFLPGSFYRRLTHRKVGWTSCRIERGLQPEEIGVPAGKFAVMVYRVTTGDGRGGRFWVEMPYPHRIVRWEWGAEKGGGGEAAEVGELTGSARLKYWQLHGNGHEKYLRQLGLKTPTVDD